MPPWAIPTPRDQRTAHPQGRNTVEQRTLAPDAARRLLAHNRADGVAGLCAFNPDTTSAPSATPPVPMTAAGWNGWEPSPNDSTGDNVSAADSSNRAGVFFTPKNDETLVD